MAEALPERFRLRDDFRFVHEPIDLEDGLSLPHAHAAMMRELQERVMFSRGGAFLIAGFRGVGKTSLVRSAIRNLSLGPSTVLVEVNLSVARPISGADLLFAIIRRVFEELDRRQILDSLDESTRHSLLVAYVRTSLSLSETKSNANERTSTVSMGGGMPSSGVALLGNFQQLLPSFERVMKSSTSASTEASFLAYAESDVEHDFLRILSLLSRTAAPRPANRPWWRFWQRDRAPQPRPSIHVAVVLDELDKLTSHSAGKRSLDELLSTLKNILSAPGAHFALVAGPDLYQQALADAAAGNGVLESVFAWQAYLPCMWSGARDLLANLLVDPIDHDRFEMIADCLDYKARGVARRLVQAVNELVEWDSEGSAWLSLHRLGAEQLALYSLLGAAIATCLGEPDPRRPPFDIDRESLAAFAVAEWAIGSEGRIFTAREAATERRFLGVEGAVVPGLPLVEAILDELTSSGVLDAFNPSEGTRIDDSPSNRERRYRLSETSRERLKTIIRFSERDRAGLVNETTPTAPHQDRPPAPSIPTTMWNVSAPAPPSAPIFTGYSSGLPTIIPSGEYPSAAAAVADSGALMAQGAIDFEVPRDERAFGAGRYRLDAVIGQGGMGVVYRGTDLGVADRTVAIKVLENQLFADQRLRERFRREAEIAKLVSHPNVVATYDYVEERGRLGIVMEYLEGEILTPSAVDRASRAVDVTVRLCEPIDYLHHMNVVRLDLKPANIVMVPVRGPVLIDFGIAKRSSAAPQRELTITGVVVGTMAYLAPELLAGSRDAGPRSDVFSLGVLLYELLFGRPRLGESDSNQGFEGSLAFAALTNNAVDLSDAPCSQPVRDVLAAMLAREPQSRPPIDEVRLALMKAPEGVVLFGAEGKVGPFVPVGADA